MALFADIDAPGWAIIIGAIALIVKMVLDYMRERDKTASDKAEREENDRREEAKAKRDADAALKVEEVRKQAVEAALKVEEVRLQAIIAAKGVVAVKNTLDATTVKQAEQAAKQEAKLEEIHRATNGLVAKLEGAAFDRGVKSGEGHPGEVGTHPSGDVAQLRKAVAAAPEAIAEKTAERVVEKMREENPPK